MVVKINLKEIRQFVGEIINAAISDIIKTPPQDHPKLSPFQLKWTFGGNNNQIELTKTNIFFTISHLGVLYNTEKQQQTFLSGLINHAQCYSNNGNLLAIADTGVNDCSITLWEWKSATLLRYWLNVFPTGTKLVELSPCGEFLAAVSNSPEPIIIQWEIKGPHKKIAHLKPGNPVHLIQKADECIVTYTQSIIRISWSKFETGKLEALETPKNSSMLGQYKMSNYIESTHQIASVTSEGYAILWGNNGVYLKTIFLKGSEITRMKLMDQAIQVSFEDNTENYYDPSFRIIHRTELNTRKSSIILSMDINPQIPILVSGEANGTLTAYNFQSKTTELTKQVLSCGIGCLRFSPSGEKLAITSTRGDLLLTDSIVFDTEVVLPSIEIPITQLIFQSETEIIYVNAKDMVGGFKMSKCWTNCGQFQPHAGRIVGIIAREGKIYTIGDDKMLVEMVITNKIKLLDYAVIEESETPTSCVWHQNEIIVSNNTFRMRFIDPITKSILRTVRSPGSSPIHLMISYESDVIFAAGKEMGVFNNGSCVIAHGTRIFSLIPSSEFVFTIGRNDMNILQWKLSDSKIPPGEFTFSRLIEEKLSKLFQSGPIESSQVVSFLQILGYYPSHFEISNINREISSSQVDEKTFRKILQNYGPPPEITTEELENALLSISDIQNSKPMIHTEKLIAILQKVQKLSHEESVKCLQSLFTGGHLPPKIHLKEFMAVLGV